VTPYREPGAPSRSIALGDIARDTISGYEGVVVARTEWINNCVRFTLQAKKLTADGKPVEAVTFDAFDLELVSTREPPVEPVKHGGPRPEPSRGGR
jgi:hypothetical protein